MTSLPPAGWYPDPEANGARWRWWDGARWAAPSWGFAVVPPAQLAEAHRNATARYGNWLRWAMLTHAIASFVAYAGFAFFVHRLLSHFDLADVDGTTNFPSGLSVFQLATLPLNVTSIAHVGTLIAWIMSAGRFAEVRGWPAARGRTLGAFSVLIPFVNLWWPYEALRDAYPRGLHPPVLLRWWLAYLIAPFTAGMFAIAAAFVETATVEWMAFGFAAVVLALPVVFGWRLIADIAAMQRANSGL